MSILIEQWHRHHDREENGVVPSACLLEFVCLFVCFVLLITLYVCWVACLCVCLFVRLRGGVGAGCVEVCFG